MHILLVEPFFGGSHQTWAEGFQQFSQHQVELCTLPGRHWKWRMSGGAAYLGLRQRSRTIQPDLILASSMLDLPTFLSLAGLQGVPTALFFHENQLAYPWSPDDRDPALGRDHHYAFIQFRSALLADQVFFNSGYNLSSFLDALPDFLRKFPDKRMLDQCPALKAKTAVLPLGLHLSRFDQVQVVERKGPPVLLWNHRWEYDKDPDCFFRLCQRLLEEGYAYRLVILGASTGQYPGVFDEARARFREQIIHFGYAESWQDYAKWLLSSDILPVTSRQEFFGISVMEALYCGLRPLLPNRLVYPELIPAHLHHTFLYEGEEDLFQKTKAALATVEVWRSGDALRSLAAPYDWLTLAPRYDRIFTKMTA